MLFDNIDVCIFKLRVGKISFIMFISCQTYIELAFNIHPSNLQNHSVYRPLIRGFDLVLG